MTERDEVRCSFYIKNEHGYYDAVHVRGPSGSSYLNTPTPPAVGDTIYLKGGAFRVIRRRWLHSSWGSTDWPYDEPRPQVGPLLEMVVEPADELFYDENPTPRPDEGEL